MKCNGNWMEREAEMGKEEQKIHQERGRKITATTITMTAAAVGTTNETNTQQTLVKIQKKRAFSLLTVMRQDVIAMTGVTINIP